MDELRLQEDFLMGSATAATQIEGGDVNSNWYHWALKGKIKNGESPLIADDHYNRYREDIALMKEMNHQIYRLSIEWSRIEPEEGQWSLPGISHYQSEIKALLNAGIKPLVTLHHFSHPQWFEEMGGWTGHSCLVYFRRFAAKVIEIIGQDVNEYCTINEPNVFVNACYMEGIHPPGHKDDIRSYFKASKNLIQAHIQTYKLIHRMRSDMGFSDTKVGIAHHLTCLESIDNRIMTNLSRKLIDYSFHKLFLKGMVEGRLTFPIGPGFSRGKKRYCDFIGINYYSRHFIHGGKNPATLFGEVRVRENLADSELNDMGWEIYPEGMFKVIKETYEKYRIPIYITENGIPDSEDRKRSRFIYDHFLQIVKLIGDGVDIRRYYHWSLLDNFEWNEGYGPRFGLIEVNYETQKRTIRKSGRFYGEICRSKMITKKMIGDYL